MNNFDKTLRILLSEEQLDLWTNYNTPPSKQDIQYAKKLQRELVAIDKKIILFKKPVKDNPVEVNGVRKDVLARRSKANALIRANTEKTNKEAELKSLYNRFPSLKPKSK